MPPKNWITAAPGAEALVMPRPKTVYASKMPSPGPGFVSTMKSMDCPASLAWSMASGARTPWFMALLRKSTFAGSTMMLTSGSRPALTPPVSPGPGAALMGGGGEDAVVYGVVEEEPLRRLDDDAYERQQAGVHDRVDAGTENVAYGGDDWAGTENADDGEGAADDAGGEGVDQHLEALADPALDEAVELHDDVNAPRHPMEGAGADS